MELADFLLARCDDEEMAARAATPGPWRDTGTVLAGVATDDYVTVAVCNNSDWEGGEYSYPATDKEAGNAAHIARWNPTRVLDECKTRRALVIQLASAHGASEVWLTGGRDLILSITDQALHILALPYADHPDYQREWRP